jgi:glycerophosphoryl diester phosphodiesterase
MATAFLDHPRPLAFAHRGGAAHAPENSWRAFEHAVGLGYRYLETDLHATSDGVLVAFHDRTLTRVTGQQGRVSRLTHSELSSALIDGTEPIPRLEDLLGAWPDVRFNLDVKDVSAIAPLPAVLRRTNAWNRICVTSFSASRLRATRRILDRPVCMAASPFGTAVVRFGGPREPMRRPPHHPHPPRPLLGRPLADWLTRCSIRCVQVPVSVATPPFIQRAQSLGLQVHVWTINDPPVMERLLDLGVDGIMTDQTIALREVLTTRGEWHPR